MNYRAHVNKLSGNFQSDVIKFGDNNPTDFILVEKTPEVESALNNLKKVMKNKKKP